VVEATSAGAPLSGADVVLFKQGDFIIQGRTGADGKATFHFVPYGPDDLYVGVTGPGLIPSIATITPVD